MSDVTQGHGLLHGDEAVVFADAGYQGAEKRPEACGVDWQVATRPGKRKAQKHTPWGALSEQAEKLKASVRAKVEHPFKGPQMPVRLCEGSLQGAGQEHGAARHAVCIEQFVDGQKTSDTDGAGMSTPGVRVEPRKLPQKVTNRDQMV